MQQGPTYERGDRVWVNRGGAQMRGTVVDVLPNHQYRVAVAGQGVRIIQERALSPREPEDDTEQTEEANPT